MNNPEELVPNRLASDVLSLEEPLSVEDALRHATSLAEALRRVHQSGAVFGCLDPDHVVWNGRGAKLIPNEARGLTAYSSPEQVRGEQVDGRSDIFSFGAIVYELFTGKKAFAAHDAEDWKREILERSPAPPAGIPEDLAKLVMRCLEKRREDRWQRINSILIELKLAQAGARQAQAASEWRDRVVSLRSQIAAHQAERTAVDEGLRQSIERLEESMQSQSAEIGRIQETLVAVQESIAALQKGGQLHAKAIEGLESAASQTDEVVEHVVEAFGRMHQALVERGESKVLLVSRNAS